MISCLMVTQEKKADMAKQAIRDFNRQSFKDRELIVVQDSSEAFHQDLREFIKEFPEDDIHLYHVEQTTSLGELRNFSVEKAKYSLICQWDDDDLYHPDRIKIQYELLQKDDSDFCFFTDQLHWYKERNLFFWDDWNVEKFPMNLIQGTVLGKKELLGKYPSLGRGEDTPVIVDIAQRGCKISKLENHGYLYIYTYNGDNVWDFNHHAAISEWKRYRLDRLEENKENLIRYLSEYGLPFDKVLMPHDQGVLEIALLK